MSRKLLPYIHSLPPLPDKDLTKYIRATIALVDAHTMAASVKDDLSAQAEPGTAFHTTANIDFPNRLRPSSIEHDGIGAKPLPTGHGKVLFKQQQSDIEVMHNRRTCDEWHVGFIVFGRAASTPHLDCPCWEGTIERGEGGWQARMKLTRFTDLFLLFPPLPRY